MRMVMVIFRGLGWLKGLLGGLGRWFCDGEFGEIVVFLFEET